MPGQSHVDGRPGATDTPVSRANRPFAGVDAVEIKLTIRPDQELRAERALAVDEDTANIRVVYYYDTPNLALFEAGVALRARQVKDRPDDSTVKFRPVEAARVAKAWRQQKGFKLEADWVGDHVVCAACFTQPQRRDEIDEVADGKRPIEKLFSEEQERFLREMYKGPIQFGDLCVMGPIRVLRWKPTHLHFSHELTVEEWRLPNGDDLVEVSIKAAAESAGQARRAFGGFLDELGLDQRGAQETKTRTALTYFAAACR